MAKYPIDIEIDTGPSEKGLDSLESQLNRTRDSTIAAAQAADRLTRSSDEIARATSDLYKAQARSAAQAVATARATREQAQEQSRLLAAQAAAARQAGQNINLNSKFQEQAKIIAQATRDEKAAIDQLSQSMEKLERSQSNVQQSTQGTSNGIGQIVSAGKALLGLAVASEVARWGQAFVETATQVDLLQSRIAFYTQSQQEANSVFAQLVSISNESGTSLENTAQVYQRFAAAGKDLGVTSPQLLKFVDTLNKAAIVSGASAQEAGAAIYQLSQAFASGRLQGDEFRSVSEQMPIVLQILSKQLGVTVGELKSMGSEGEITSDKLLLLNNASDEVNARFDQMPRTVAQASQALQNNLAVAIDLVNEKLGITAGLARQLDGLSAVLENIGKRASGTYGEYDKLNEQIGTQTMLLNKLKDAAKGSDPKSMTGRNYAKEIANQQKIVEGLNNEKKARDRLSNLAGNLQQDTSKAAIKPRQTREAEKALKDQQEALRLSKLSTEEAGRQLAINRAVEKLGKGARPEDIAQAKALAAATYDNEQARKADIKASNKQEKASERAAKQLEKHQEQNQRYIKTLQDKASAQELDTQNARIGLQYSLQQGQSVEQLTYQYRAQAALQNQVALAARQQEAQSRLNKDATDAEKASVDQYVASLYKQQQAAQLASQVGQINTDVKGELNPVGAQEDQINNTEAQRLSVIEQARQADLISEQQYQDQKTAIQQAGEQARNQLTAQNNAMLLGATGDAFGGLADILKNSQGEQSGIYKAMFAASKAFAIAQASVLLWQNVSQAMGVGFPQNIPFIAAALAQGTSILGSLSSIQSVGFANGGYIKGPGTGRSDSINARLSNGEFVTNAASTSRYRSTLESINNGTYREGQSGMSQPNISVHNYGGERVQVQQLTAEDVRIIVGEEVPRVNQREFSSPYSKSNKALNNSYALNRKV